MIKNTDRNYNLLTFYFSLPFFFLLKVPPYFNQFERQALLDAAELANLRVFSLINDETAGEIDFFLK